ncbi:ImmA/IrrE family metallo-endopeptidase [Clostridium neonatale]|uniref:ImmA/IrrE family metallo-endopeptidase n=1 Tax=Clostridium neonatale TaxID=137838 RepID=UPI00291BF067|nr:ImmA/IrrE family metallo-endopeptidase [Clostridium neonatale]CAI3203090.1 Peptidase_M78 domain-containing protein [Clostridium neonatale]
MIFSTIRYKQIHKIVNDIYINLYISSFPIDIITIINLFENIKILSYSQFMKRYKHSYTETLEILNSKEGCTYYDPVKDNYVIFYNDLDTTLTERIYWTIAHEFGHIMCGHHIEDTSVKNHSLSEEKYRVLECEANYFASIFLAHPAILSRLNIHNSYEIEVFCNLSSQAARYRYENFKKWTRYNFMMSSDKHIIHNFEGYIDSKNQDYQEHQAFIQAFYR